MAEALRLTIKQRRERVRWSKGRKQRFLATLAESCDIEAACAAATLDWLGICQLKAMDPQFAADWDAVIAAHYARIEAALLREAGAATGEINAPLARELLKQRGASSAARKAAATAKPPPNGEKRIADFMRQFRPAGAPNQAKDDHGPHGTLAVLAGRHRGGRSGAGEAPPDGAR